MERRWTLERIGPKKEEFEVLSSYTNCGRGKFVCHLRCRGKFVSKEHCVFLILDKKFHVVDLESSNGTYVNGHLIKERIAVALEDNDIVGIGSEEIDADDIDEDMFVYKVKSRIVLLRRQEQNML